MKKQSESHPANLPKLVMKTQACQISRRKAFKNMCRVEKRLDIVLYRVHHSCYANTTIQNSITQAYESLPGGDFRRA